MNKCRAHSRARKSQDFKAPRVARKAQHQHFAWLDVAAGFDLGSANTNMPRTQRLGSSCAGFEEPNRPQVDVGPHGLAYLNQL